MTRRIGLPDVVVARMAAHGVKLDMREQGGGRPPIELRSVDTLGVSDGRIQGHAAIWDQTYPVAGGPSRGGFNETIRRSSVARNLNSSPDIVLNVNHGADGALPIARTSSGTLEVSATGYGLRVYTPVPLDPSNPNAAAALSAIARQDAPDMSWAFAVRDDEWDAKYENRVIREVQIFDVSIVTTGANRGTDIGLADGRGDIVTLAEVQQFLREQFPHHREPSAALVSLAEAREFMAEHRLPVSTEVERLRRLGIA